ncbi:MAG: DUF874 family protein [Spirulinaceae cyanobacterium RM2_2_10]|nr:DUF874 family protein [Spirulinaceae cyanobacterium SM2_1_0]NJO19719.1 DUF874 family protein [Spirulinaceae cyanobacterium RM2_2_10]
MAAPQYTEQRDRLVTAEPVEVPIPDVESVTIEDDTPVDSIFSEKQQRLLTTCLYSSPSLARPFIAVANVGLFFTAGQPAIVPDVMLSLGIAAPGDWSQKVNRSYFVWNLGKPPDIVIEIVSNKVGNELGSKLDDYARGRIAYYVVFDPLQYLGEPMLRIYRLVGTQYQAIAEQWFEDCQIGLTLWSGQFEDQTWDTWLRWCDGAGNVLLTGDERAEQERQRAEQERQRAEQERQRAEQERQRSERLMAMLRDRGIDPETLM